MRRTRILATIGPASNSASTIRELLEAGVDAFRLNFSHGKAADHAATCRTIREVARELDRHVAVLQDLGGPKIRVGTLAEPLRLVLGDQITIERGTFVGSGTRVPCAFDALFTSVSAGDTLRVDDGRIGLVVDAADADRLTARVIDAGVLQSGKGINVPSAVVKTAALTDKDRADLAAGIEMGVDLVALSFVQAADDVVAARRAADALGAVGLPIIAKIEKPQAVDHLEEILDVADGLMVARGDLGVEIPLEMVPTAQRRIVMAARRRGLPVILATEVLESMRQQPRPTRAEVSDAAHAVGEGVDAIMLSGETAVGQFPVRAVSVLDAVIREAERAGGTGGALVPQGGVWTAHGIALGEAAVALAASAHAKAIVALTREGKTARLLAAMRPAAGILAVTPNEHVAGRVSLVWGVTPVVTDHRGIGHVRDVLVAHGLLAPGDVVVFVSIAGLLGHEHINFVHVEEV